MKGLVRIALFSLLISWQVSALAQATLAQERRVPINDASGKEYYIILYYDDYNGIQTTLGNTVEAFRFTGVKDTRTDTITSDFTADVREDIERALHKMYPCLTEATHVGSASIKYNCFAYAYGVTNCWISDDGITTFIDDGDLVPTGSMVNAKLALHGAETPLGSSFDHGSRVVAGTPATPSCSNTKGFGEVTWTKQGTLPILYQCRSKFSHGCIHDISCSYIEDIYNSEHTYCYPVSVPMR